jgi:phosphoribosyl 1,2-cyclic phosphate phosphodiesterase
MAAGTLTIDVTVLGSGTSVGVPTIGCRCKVCQSEDPRDRRLRPSILIEAGGYTIVVDTSPDFRQQALRYGIPRVDAVLFTHGHADHILGLDDLRPFNFHQRGHIPIYASEETMTVVRRCFSYIFDDGPTESSRPKLEARLFDSSPFCFNELTFQPIRLHHGKGTAHGFRLGNFAYLTDHSEIPDESMELLGGLDHLFLDALRHNPHPTHSTVDRSLKYVEKLAPKRAWFTHISHDLSHARTEDLLPPHVRLAYDGLRIRVGESA